MIEMRDGRYFSRFFYQELATCNVMGALYRDETKGNRWTILFRYRYFVDDKVFDSEDRRSWQCYSFADDLDEQGAVEKLEQLADVLLLAAAKLGGGVRPVQIVPVESDRVEVVTRVLADQSWSSMRREDGGGAEA